MDERHIARTIVREIVESVKSLPANERVERADLHLHRRLLAEMCAFNDRLKSHVEDVLRTALGR